MSNRVHVMLLSAALTVASTATARAQPGLDRVVGPTSFAAPLTIKELTVHTIGVLAVAAGVPMGLELAQTANVQPWAVKATGMKLQTVLDAIVAADSRYEWREDDGVVVFRPVASWIDGTEMMDIATAPLKREDMQAVDALILLAQLFEQRGSLTGPGDTKHFSIDLPPGRLFDALNGIVRAHGTMAWMFEERGNRGSGEVFLHLITDTSGSGFGIPLDAPARRQLLSATVISSLRPAGNVPPPVLDRIVGTRRDGRPLILLGLSDVPELADAVGVPMGVELLPPKLRDVLRPEMSGFSGITATGLPLRYVLSALSALDARYEWRDLDGVIVLRPVDAWTDADHPLFRLINAVRLDDVPSSEAVGLVLSLLGRRTLHPDFPDARRVAIDLPQGTMLELLNAFAKSHGEMCWQWNEFPAADRRVGHRYSVTFTVFGGRGHGFGVP